MFTPRVRIMTGTLSVAIYAGIAVLFWNEIRWAALAAAAMSLFRFWFLVRQIGRVLEDREG